jgi:hypothetical protein
MARILMQVSPERRQLEKHLMKPWRMQWLASLPAVGFGAVVYGVMVALVVGFDLLRRVPSDSTLHLVVMLTPLASAFAAMCLSAWFLYLEVPHRTIERRYDRGECAWCRYALANDTVKTCPECGNPPVVQ